MIAKPIQYNSSPTNEHLPRPQSLSFVRLAGFPCIIYVNHVSLQSTDLQVQRAGKFNGRAPSIGL